MKLTKIQIALLELFLKLNLVGFKPDGLTLKSGKFKHWYANCRILAQKMEYLDESSLIIKDFIVENFNLDEIDAILGVPEGATLLGNATQEQLIITDCLEDNLYSLRSKPKEHGDIANKYWTNGNVPKKVILLEDVTTTGGSVIELALRLQDEMNIEIVGIVGLFNRQELDKNKKSVEEVMELLNFKYLPILNAENILQQMIDALPSVEREDAITKINANFWDEYGETSPVILE